MSLERRSTPRLPTPLWVVRALSGSPAADFGRLFADETEKWGKVVRAAN